jgi:Alr-MurF fusion protein
MKFSDLPSITGGSILSLYRDDEIKTLNLDSRKAVSGSGSVFFAIRGERHNGHHYIQSLYEAGIRQFVVEEPLDSISRFGEANILSVSSTIRALQLMASHHRASYSLPVIGVTGSNGKTIIKEWLYQLLSRDQYVVKNPGSFNSQIGVPLSVWQIGDHHTIGVFEAGISRKDEMNNLRDVILPTLGIFSNIGPAHNEGFTSIDEKLDEKLKLFTGVTKLIYCKDHIVADAAITKKKIPSVAWGFSDSAAIRIKQQGPVYNITYDRHAFSFELPFDDRASAENCFHVISTLLVLGYSPEFITAGITTLRTVPMRMELKEAVNQCYMIDDTYNNDLGGIEISLQFLKHQQQKKKKTVILSDVLESGLNEADLVRQIAELVYKNNVDRFLGVGPVLTRHSDYFSGDSEFFLSTNDFLTRFRTEELNNEVILVKGARVFGFEEITKRLQRKVHGTVMEIDLDALVHNFNLVKSRVRRSTKVMVMVKAFAYGSGSSEIANLLQFHKADYLGVAYPDEGVELRQNNISLPIMVMNATEESFDQLIRYNLEAEVYSFKILKALIAFLNGKECGVHLKLDTGMRRLGFESADIDELMGLLTSNSNIRVNSIFSHLAGADDPAHDNFSRSQANLFKKNADAISDALGYRPIYHLLNSPGVLRLPELQFDMVRLGIGLYGVDPTGGFAGFRNVVTLKTIISQIKHIKKGETVGYGRAGSADADLTIATIAIGYADGFSRAFSDGAGKVLIHGHLAPVIGNVCMDMTMVNITGIPACEGDEVVVFGRDLAIEKVASWIRTIPYEILTNTSERVRRVFTAESL